MNIVMRKVTTAAIFIFPTLARERSPKDGQTSRPHPDAVRPIQRHRASPVPSRQPPTARCCSATKRAQTLLVRSPEKCSAQKSFSRLCHSG